MLNLAAAPARGRTRPWCHAPRCAGPPPEVRALFDAFTQAINSGSAETWVAFVQARFAPPLIQNGTSQQRAEMYWMLVRDLSTIAIERAMCEGRDAPLQLRVKGSRGNGVVILGIDESSPLRIVSFGVEAGGRAGRAQSGLQRLLPRARLYPARGRWHAAQQPRHARRHRPGHCWRGAGHERDPRSLERMGGGRAVQLRPTHRRTHRDGARQRSRALGSGFFPATTAEARGSQIPAYDQFGG